MLYRTESCSHPDLDGEVQWSRSNLGESVLRKELSLQHEYNGRAAVFDYRTKCVEQVPLFVIDA